MYVTMKKIVTVKNNPTGSRKQSTGRKRKQKDAAYISEALVSGRLVRRSRDRAQNHMRRPRLFMYPRQPSAGHGLAGTHFSSKIQKQPPELFMGNSDKYKENPTNMGTHTHFSQRVS